ncbi:hypothetical protein M3J09_006776 [Ascochyta lentis]
MELFIPRTGRLMQVILLRSCTMVACISRVGRYIAVRSDHLSSVCNYNSTTFGLVWSGTVSVATILDILHLSLVQEQQQ